MSNSEKSKHWKSLAALLGTASEEELAEPTSESPPPPEPVAVTKPAPPPYVPPPPPAPRPAPKKPATPQRRQSHWGKLANVLGLAGAPEPQEEEPVAEPVAELPFVPPPTIDSEAEAMAAAHWNAPTTDDDRGLDPLEMVSEPFVDEAFDAVDLDSIQPAASESEGTVEERRRRRRRRRGRGRGRHAEAESTSRSPADIDDSEEALVVPAEAATDSVVELDADFEEVPDVEPTDATERAADDDEEAPRRRRRRRRGRRGRRDQSGAEAPSSEGRQQGSSTGRREPPPRGEQRPSRRVEEELDDDEPLDELSVDEDLDDDDVKGDDLQFSHKKIPSWYEAIEGVIATNMASRASNPSSGGRHRGRGRRDR